ncbi:MarR family winged helix-turn-helix transcriptional regulator [Nocardia alni]|uniref:MarR family winged helix-turn-helix transcriptional regulator n=1 Tax=Nocardia alni TaxID=2815723 RepID=UPI001C248C2B|nr:MarR family transcriptional regulator [Nocardia alni]
METEATAENSGVLDETGLGAEVRSAVGRLYRRFRSELPAGELGDTALEVLTYLHKRGPRTLTELSEAGRVAPASMSQTLNRLTSAGYAIRTPDPNDRRKVLFRTTTEGATLARATRSQRNAWLDAQLAALSPEDQRTVARACELLGAIADS